MSISVYETRVYVVAIQEGNNHQ